MGHLDCGVRGEQFAEDVLDCESLIPKFLLDKVGESASGVAKVYRKRWICIVR